MFWFHRGQETQDSVAKAITTAVRKAMDAPEQDVAVIFTALTPAAYYDNGEHY